MEYLVLAATGMMLVVFIYDIVFVKNFSLIFALISSPFLSGSIMYLSVFGTSLAKRNKSISAKYSYTFIFIGLLIMIISSYFDKSIGFRTIVQLIQFVLIVTAVFFVIFPNKIFINNTENALMSLMLSSILLSGIKFVFFILGELDFNINGQNEDSFLLVLIGCVSGLLYFKKLSLFSGIYFSIILLALFLYGSRAAQMMGFLTISAYFVASYTKFRIRNLLVVFILFLIILIGILFNIDDVRLFWVSTTDLERNHSNIERVAMYIYTYDYLLSGGGSYGLGNIEVAMEDMRRAGVIIGQYPHPHSSYLRFTLEFGVAGLLGFVLFFLVLLHKAIKLYSTDPRISVILSIALVNILAFSFVESVFFSFFRASAVLLVLSLVVAKAIENVIVYSPEFRRG